MTMINIIISILYVFDPISAIDYSLHMSNVPQELHYDYKVVMMCESQLNPLKEGDGGMAQGLLQIHHSPWIEWAKEEGLGNYDLFEPLDNINLAYDIQEKYDLPRNRNRWNQWTVKPTWKECQQRLKEFSN